MEHEEKRHDILIAGMSATLEMLGDEPTDESVILACDFMFELTKDHKLQRATEALEKSAA